MSALRATSLVPFSPSFPHTISPSLSLQPSNAIASYYVMPCCSALPLLLLLLPLLRVSSLHRPVVSEHPVPSLTKEGEREERRPTLLPPRSWHSRFATLARQPAMGTTQLSTWNSQSHTERSARWSTYAVYGNSCFIEREMKDDERERRKE